MNEDNYIYSVTRIRALENRLLDKSKIDRMVEAKNPEEVIKVLYETSYAGSVSEINDIGDYEEMLSKEVGLTYKMVKKMAPEPELIDILLLKYDIHNLKVLMKSSFLNEENDDLLTDIGTIEPVKLKEMIREKNFVFLDPEIKRGLEEIVNSFSINPDPQVIDIILDRCLYTVMSQIAVNSKNNFMEEFVQLQIDLINIRMFIRVKAMGYGREFLKKAFIGEGKLDYNFFVDAMDEPIDVLKDKLLISDYSNVISEGIDSYIKTKSLMKFEKLSDDFLLDYVKKGKYVAFGIEPIVGYIMAKENEAKIIRIIMVGKINNIDNELIRERLRDVYV